MRTFFGVCFSLPHFYLLKWPSVGVMTHMLAWWANRRSSLSHNLFYWESFLWSCKLYLFHKFYWSIYCLFHGLLSPWHWLGWLWAFVWFSLGKQREVPLTAICSQDVDATRSIHVTGLSWDKQKGSKSSCDCCLEKRLKLIIFVFKKEMHIPFE